MTIQEGFATLEWQTDKGNKTIGKILAIDEHSDGISLRVAIPKKLFHRILINNGLAKAKPSKIKKVAEYFGVTIESLLTIEEEA